MNKGLLGKYTISEEAPKEHVVEVHYQDLKEDKYQKEKVTGTKLNEVVDEAFVLVNEITGDEEKELKFVGFPSDD
tara:strand:- start:1569 stop:1793 length:225 start_codon:yes stop_codon:yes gene_type:complete